VNDDTNAVCFVDVWLTENPSLHSQTFATVKAVNTFFSFDVHILLLLLLLSSVTEVLFLDGSVDDFLVSDAD
jgi:hypothetical protein